MHLQHHNVPTRLIDWTRDILVGLFFACWDKEFAHVSCHGSLSVLLTEEIGFYDPLLNNDDARWRHYDP